MWYQSISTYILVPEMHLTYPGIDETDAMDSDMMFVSIMTFRIK